MENSIGTTITATKPSPIMAKSRCFENIRNDATNSRTSNQKNIRASQYTQRSRKDKSTRQPTR